MVLNSTNNKNNCFRYLFNKKNLYLNIMLGKLEFLFISYFMTEKVYQSRFFFNI